jgi:hypothetical protein
MVYVLEDVSYQSLPKMSPTDPIRTRGPAMSRCPFVKPESALRVFMAHPHPQGHLVSKPLPKIANRFVIRGPALGIHGRFLPSVASSYNRISHLSRSLKPLTEAIRHASAPSFYGFPS